MNEKALALREKKETLEGLLEKASGDFEKVIRRDYLTVDRLIKTAIVAATRTPKLLECDPKTFLQSCMVAAELSLEISNSLGQMYLVPFGTTCTPIIGYKGYIALAIRSGAITQVRSRLVYARDEFEIEYGLHERLIHKPYMGSEDPGPVTGAYCVAQIRDADPLPEYMTRAQLDKIRNGSPAYKRGGDTPWKTHEEAMQRKCPIRKAANYWPLTSIMARAIEVDNEADEFERSNYARNVTSFGGVEDLNSRLGEETPEAETMGPPMTPAAFKKTVKACGADLQKFEERYGTSVDDWSPDEMLDAMAILERIGNGQTYDEAAA